MGTKPAHESEYDFALLLTGVTELSPGMENALFEAGCDDATISLRAGRVFVTFTRAAPSFEDAVRTATRDVLRADIGADSCLPLLPTSA